MGTDLIFSKEEHKTRVRNVQEDMRTHDLDALLACEPESVTDLTGILSPRGYKCFHFAVIPFDGEPGLVFRDMEAYHFRRSAAFERTFRWLDGDDVDALAAGATQSVVGASAEVCIERFDWQLNARRYENPTHPLPLTLTIVDAGSLVWKRRLIKYAGELDYWRRAGRAVETAMDAAREASRAGAREGDIGGAAASAAVLAGDRGEPRRHCSAGDVSPRSELPCTLHAPPKGRTCVGGGGCSRLTAIRDPKSGSIRDRARRRRKSGRSDLPRGRLGNGKDRSIHQQDLLFVGLYPNGSEFLGAAPKSTWSFEVGTTFHTYLFVDGFAISETIAMTATGYES